MAQALTLPSILKAVSKTLSENEAALNEADTYNHNHGTNIAAAFTSASKAVARKKDLPVAEQLAFASEVMQGSSSGSAKIYAQGLATAAQQFQGNRFTRQDPLDPYRLHRFRLDSSAVCTRGELGARDRDSTRTF